MACVGSVMFAGLSILLYGGVSRTGLILAVVALAGAAPALSLLMQRCASLETQQSWLKVGAYSAMLAAIPIIGLMGFFVSALVEEHFTWRPAWDEAVVVVLICLSGFLLPVCAWRLWRAGSQAAAGGGSATTLPPTVFDRALGKLWSGMPNISVALAIIGLLILTAWGNAVAMLVMAVVMLAGGLVLRRRRAIHWRVLAALAAVGIAVSVFWLVQQQAAQRAAVRAGFEGVVETVLRSSEGRIAEMLDLDTGHRGTSMLLGENDAEARAWIRSNRLDVLGVIGQGRCVVLCMDMAVVPASSNAWETITVRDVIAAKGLAPSAVARITSLTPITAKTDTWLFRTREGGRGVLQILGTSQTPRGVKIRYKLLPSGGGKNRGG